MNKVGRLTSSQEKRIVSTLRSHLKDHIDELLSDPEEWGLEDRIPEDLTRKEISNLIKLVLR